MSRPKAGRNVLIHHQTDAYLAFEDAASESEEQRVMLKFRLLNGCSNVSLYPFSAKKLLLRKFVVEKIAQTSTICTVKLARANVPANAGNFTCSSQVKRSLAQFTCVTCSLPVITGKFTCFEAASTSRRTHAHCLRALVNLPENHMYFTGSFTCGTHANLPATSMQNCLLLQAKMHATYRQKHWNRR